MPRERRLYRRYAERIDIYAGGRTCVPILPPAARAVPMRVLHAGYLWLMRLGRPGSHRLPVSLPYRHKAGEKTKRCCRGYTLRQQGGDAGTRAGISEW